MRVNGIAVDCGHHSHAYLLSRKHDQMFDEILKRTCLSGDTKWLTRSTMFARLAYKRTGAVGGCLLGQTEGSAECAHWTRTAAMVRREETRSGFGIFAVVLGGGELMGASPILPQPSRST
ncbi:hypothetical protein C6W92_15385 [Roseovarius sp. A46]|nr:hypothetical protein C6W92_15385 [Roseovarius sp. A46]